MAGTWTELSVDVLQANLRELLGLVKSTTRIIMPLQADAYGHGLEDVSRAAWDRGVKAFLVDSLDAGLATRTLLPDAQILLHGHMPPDAVRDAADARLTPIVSDEPTGRELARHAAAELTAVRCHVAVRVGAGGRGFDADDDLDRVARLTRTPGLRIEGFSSRFTDGGTPDTTRSEVELARFYKTVTHCTGPRARSVFRHISDAPSLLRSSYWDLDGVRPGLLCYGYPPDIADPERTVRVRPCLTWKSRLEHVRRVKGGRATGYGGRDAPTGGMWIGEIHAGYADGYRRVRREPGHVLIRGRPYPILPPVGLDTLAVDLGSAAPTVQPGDEVVLLGCQDDQTITATDLAEWCDTVSGEILTGIAASERRIVGARGQPEHPQPMHGGGSAAYGR